MPVTTQRFYSPWPDLDVQLSEQWEKLRDNHRSLLPIVRAAEVDLGGDGAKDLSFWNVGELNFRNRYRSGYDHTNSGYKIQYNTGSEITPVWVDVIFIRDSDRLVLISGDLQASLIDSFYGVIFRESEAGGFRQRSDQVIFDSNFFYLTTSGNQKPLVSLVSAGSGETNTASNLGAGSGVFAQKSGVDLQFKSLVAGSNITLTPSATEIAIASSSSGGGGFYGIVIKESESGGRTERDDTLVFDSDSGFYISSTGNDSKPLVSFHDHVIAVQSTDTGDQNIIASESTTGAGHTINLKRLSAGNNIVLVVDSNQISIASTAAGGGFYGVVFRDSRRTEKDDTLVFDNDSGFYLTQAGSDSKPLLAFHDHVEIIQSSSTGDVSIISDDTALGAGHTVTLKRVSAGNNINVSTDSNQITVSAPGIGPGFYGVIFRESKAGGRVERDDTLVFDSNSGFYLSQTGNDSKPLLSFHDHIENIQDSVSGTETLISSDSAVGAGHTIALKKFNAGDNVLLSSDSNTITITSINNFYGITFKESESGGRTERDDTLVFDSEFFYLTQTGNDSKPLLSLNDPKITFAESESGGFNKTSTKVNFDSNFFYLTSGGDNNPLISLRDIQTLISGGRVLLSNQTVSGSSAVNFTNVMTSDYDWYELNFFNVQPSTDSQFLLVQISLDNGASYKAGSTDYEYGQGLFNSLDGTNALGDAADTGLRLGTEEGGVGNWDSAQFGGGKLDIVYAGDSGGVKNVFTWHIGHLNDAGNWRSVSGAGRYKSAGRINAFRLLFASGNISGTFRLYGNRNS